MHAVLPYMLELSPGTLWVVFLGVICIPSRPPLDGEALSLKEPCCVVLMVLLLHPQARPLLAGPDDPGDGDDASRLDFVTLVRNQSTASTF